MTITIHYTYRLAPELLDVYHDEQFKYEDSQTLESTPGDDPAIHVNYYTWEKEFPYGYFEITKVTKMKAKESTLNPSEYYFEIDP